MTMWQKTRMKELHSKKFSRKQLRPVSGKLGLSKEDAEQALATKLQKEVDAEKKRIDNNFMKMWRMERDEMHVKGVAARKAEKARAKQLKEMMKTYNSIPHELFQPIPDPEAEWKATNEVWIVEEAKKKAKKNSNVNPTNPTNNSEGEEDTTITVDEESWLQRDFVSFEMDDAELDAELNVGLDAEIENNQGGQGGRGDDDFDDDFDDDYDDDVAFQALLYRS